MLRTSLLLLFTLPGLFAATDAKTTKDGSNAILMQELVPAAAAPGAVVTVIGLRLDADHISAVYLTDGKNDYLAEIVEQKDATLRFRIPAKVPPGRMRIAVEEVSSGMVLDEPVFVTVLAPPLPTSTGF